MGASDRHVTETYQGPERQTNGALPEGAKGWAVLVMRLLQIPGGVAIGVLAVVFAMASGFMPSEITATKSEVTVTQKLMHAHIEEAARREDRMARVLEAMIENQRQIGRWVQISVCEKIPSGGERDKCYAIGNAGR